MTSEAASCPKHLAPDRIVGYAQHRLVILRQRDCDRKLRHAADELFRAVERIDYPDARTLQPRPVVLGLLGEPSIVGERIAQIRGDRAVGLEVSGSHRTILTFGADRKV